MRSLDAGCVAVVVAVVSLVRAVVDDADDANDVAGYDAADDDEDGAVMMQVGDANVVAADAHVNDDQSLWH